MGCDRWWQCESFARAWLPEKSGFMICDDSPFAGALPKRDFDASNPLNRRE